MSSVSKQSLFDWLYFNIKPTVDNLFSLTALLWYYEARNVTSEFNSHDIYLQLSYFTLFNLLYNQLDLYVYLCVFVCSYENVLYACTYDCECMREKKWNRQIHQTSTGF